MIGKTICHYQILDKLGEGGMGVVYKARDTHLDRFVAIKVLPHEKVADPERKRRFIQEAKAASALNHPNIIIVHDIANEHDTDFIVMEYVQGKTLDALIPRKGMRLTETLRLAIQMADALSRAHSAGIIHRDLKPTNLMVTDNGLVKILDFGLAKLIEQSNTSELASTRTMSGTDEGVILGTVSYMSPEQAEGKQVDPRSDIFSFGAVLYEVVTGRRAFQGETKLSTLTAILHKDPKRASEIIEDLPKEMERIISRCLRKEPSRRFQHMDDLKVDLEELKQESDSGMPATVAIPRRRKRPWLWAGAAVVVSVVALAVWLFRRSPTKPQSSPQVIPLTSYAGLESSPNFSPDGNQVAFSWNGEKQENVDIYVKLIGSGNAVRLTRDPADDVSPAFSPNGRSIGFVRMSKERSTFIVIPALGGPERLVGEVVTAPNPFVAGPVFAWFPDGKWVVTDGLMLMSTDTGETRRLTSPPMKLTFDFSPAISPDGRTVAFSRSTSLFMSEIYLLSLTEDLKPQGEPRRLTSLTKFSCGAAWTPDAREIIFTSEGLWKIPVSDTGEPQRLPFISEDASWPALSRSGNQLAYQRGRLDPNIWRLSLAGLGVAGGPPSRFIATTRWDSTAQYSPDGRRIAFDSDRNGVDAIWVSDADGSNAVELFSKPGAGVGSAHWSPDGQRIAFDFNAERNFDIYVIPASGGKAIRLTADLADDTIPSWSRDGKWVYFASKRTGRVEVWKVPAGGGQALQVTRNGGETAAESPDGKSIYYTKGEWSGSLWKMPVIGGSESQVLPSVHFRGFSLVNDGIYFIPESGAEGKSSIQFLSFATGKVKTVAPISGLPWEGLSVSPDGRFILFSQADEVSSDLMLVENFR